MENMEPGRMMAESPAHVPWVYSAAMVLAVWLIVSPFSFGYGCPALVWSDILSGVAVLGITASALLLPRKRAWSFFGVAAVGLWLLFAPLVFWAPDAATYVNDTLVGALLITFALLVPMGMPMGGPEVPPGWTYNPSSWPQRAPVIALGLVGFFISRYLAAYQLGHLGTVWEPFFGSGRTGTQAVLESEVSRAWPISDAGLGAITYLLEVLSGFMGDRKRWRTMPWMVAMFGVLVVPLGVVSTVLIILQPLMVGTWCTLCLVSALAMVVMIPLALDEVVAMVQFLRREKQQRGTRYWHAFWFGGTPEGAREEPPMPTSGRAAWKPREMVRGLTASWQLLLATALGVWLMFSPALFGGEGALADSSHLVGALVIVVSIIAMAEVGRPTRFLNLPLGAWLVAAPWLLAGGDFRAGLNSTLVGLVVALLSLPTGKHREHYGRADRIALWARRWAR